MTKSRDDEIYEQGVHMGQNANLLQQFADNLAPVITREDEIFQRGYDYGVTHKNSKEDDDDDLIEEEIEISKDEIESPSLRNEENLREVNNESEENFTEVDDDYDYNQSIDSIRSKKNEEKKKERRRKIINLVNKMTSNEIENSLAPCTNSRKGIKEQDPEICRELYRRKIIDEKENIYQLISYSKYDDPDNSFKEYAERRLEELIAQNPELEEIRRYSWFEAQVIGAKDANGKKAYAEAKERKNEREKAVREIMPLTNLEELKKLRNDPSISCIERDYARRRYEEVKNQENKKKPRGLIGSLIELF